MKDNCLYKPLVSLGLALLHGIKTSLEMFSKIITFCLILLQCSVQIQGLVCPDCVDYRYKFFDMPGISENQIEKTLESLGDILCRSNNKDPLVCGTDNSGDYTNKCMDVFSTIVFKGLSGHGENAGVKLETVVRSCTSRPKGEPDNCDDFSDIDGYDSSQVEQMIRSYQNIFSHVELNGQVCYSSNYTKGYQQPLQRDSANWMDSPANRVHVSSVLYVISIMFSFKLFS